MIYIAICDDNKKSVEVLENKVSAWLKENHKRAEVHTIHRVRCYNMILKRGSITI